MTKIFSICCTSLCLFFISSSAARAVIVDHQLSVRLDPQTQSLRVNDQISINHTGQVDFTLHAGLQPRTDTPGAVLHKTGDLNGEVPLESWRIKLPGGHTGFSLSYGGKIDHAFKSRTEAPGRQQALLTGTISQQGVFLDGRVAWYPLIANSSQTFSLSITLPEHWLAISQGKGPKPAVAHDNTVIWSEQQPQQDIYLIAGQYQAYSRDQAGQANAQVFLRQPDEALAQRYLDATEHYIRQYESLIGDYPYAKFALVENFWETGYGMPSFTLLGPTVIGLPFILHSSYPHEVLHNWWGNGVYVDYESGNWSEGLTTYLADHLIKEQHGGGIDYRRNTLQNYASHVRAETDFPLRTFVSRHNEGSQAVGYGKSLMLFHMLRRKLGDEKFISGLRNFYREHLFKSASFEHLRQAFEKASEQSLSNFFSQWLDRTGAPGLDIQNVQLQRRENHYEISGVIRQTQPGPAFELDIPLLIYFNPAHPPQQRSLQMGSKVMPFALAFPEPPVQIDVDPWFDLFRNLHAGEMPATLAKLFGKQSALLVLPSRAPDSLKRAYQKLAQQWAPGYAQATIKFDDEITSLEGDHAVWLLGQHNLYADSFRQTLPGKQFARQGETGQLNGTPFNLNEHSLVVAQEMPGQPVMGWISAPGSNSVQGLSRKLPHYGKYSYLLFKGEQPTIQHKGQWQAYDSPMKISLAEAPFEIKALQPAPLWPAPGE